MEKEDVKALIRSLLSSTSSSYNTRRLLREFKEETGLDLPLFGYRTSSEFLRSIPDTIKLVGEYPNEEVRLVKSEKSAHVVDLVDNQKVTTKRRKRPSRPTFGRPRPSFRRDNFSRRDDPPRRDPPPRRPRIETPYRRDPSPRREAPRNSYSGTNHRTYDSSRTFRARTPENLPVFVSPEDQEKLYNFLVEHPDGVTFDQVTKVMLERNQNWTKYNIKYGVPELIEYCSNFSTVHADKVYSLENYKKFMKSTKVEVCDNGCEPAGNESSYSEDGFFDDEFDDEYYYEEEEPPSTKSNERSIPDGIQQKKSVPCDINTFKTRLKNVMKNYPQGVWCTDLLDVYEKFYNEELKFQSYGYSSLIHMLLEMPDAVSCKQPGDGDWRVYQASNQSNDVSDVLQQVKQNVLSVLNSRNEITEAEIPPMYYKMFKERLNYDDFGFESFKDFLNSFEEELFYRKKKDNREILVPKYQMILVSNYGNQKSGINTSKSRGSSDELYPEEVVGLNEKLPELDLRKFTKIGEYVEVCVGEVWNPHKFFIQLRRLKPELFILMDKLQTWYNKFKDVHKMPDETILPDQVCVALYQISSTSAEWHRAVIKKKLEDGIILICLVDYGTVTKIKKDRLRFLHKEFASFPVQGLMARLANLSPKNSTTWSREASQRFLDLIFDKDLVAGVVDVDYKKMFLSLALSYTQGTEVHIADTLEAEGYATFVEDIITKPAVQQASQPTRQPSGPNKAMRPIEVVDIEPEEIFEINEPDNIVEIIKTQMKAPEKSKKASEPASILNTKPAVNALSAATPLAPPLSNPLPSTNPLLASKTALGTNPLASNPALASSLLNQTSYTKMASENTTLLNLNPLQPNSTASLLDQMTNLSLLGSMPTAQTTSRAPPGFGPMSEQEFKEKVNTEALKLLVSQPHINAIAKTNLDLAMQLATTIAKDQLEKERARTAQPPPLLNYLNANFYLQNLNFQNMTSNVQNPLAAVQNPLANYQNLSTNLQNLNTNVQNQIPNLQNPYQNVQNPIPNFQNLNLNVQNSKASTDSPLSPTPSTQNPNIALVHPQAVTPPRKSNSGPRRKIQIQIEEDDFKSNTPNVLPDIVKNMRKEVPSSVCLVYKMELKDKPIHIISLDDDLFVLVEEVIKRFTPFSDKNIVDKVLNSKKISFDYVLVTRKEPYTFREIERWNIERVPNQEDEFTLLPLKSLIKYIRSMVRIDDGTALAVYQFVENCEAELKPSIS